MLSQDWFFREYKRKIEKKEAITIRAVNLPIYEREIRRLRRAQAKGDADDELSSEGEKETTRRRTKESNI